MKKKKPKIILFFIKMFLLAFVVLLITDIIPVILTSSLFRNKYGYEVISELIMVLIIVIVLLVYKNSYVFTQEKEPFFKSIGKATTLLIITTIVFIQNVPNVQNSNVGTVINLLLYCISIGIAEELLCRGWIQNEFIEKYGDSRKGVITSVVLSSFIFGAMHFLNIFAGQTPLETILQVLQATSAGFLFGALYYKTGNIWASITLHAVYDFSIMLGEISLYRACTTLEDPSLSLTLYGYFLSSIIIGLYTLNGFKLLNKETIMAKINQKKEKYESNNKWLNIGIIVLFIIMFIPISPKDSDKYTVCYEYEDYEIKEDYEIRYSNKKDYQLINEELNEIVLNVTYNEGVVKISSPRSGYSITLSNDIYEYEVVETKKNYIILMERINYLTETLHYLEISKKDIMDDNDYLDSLKEKTVELMAPNYIEMGYIYLFDDDESYPIIINDLNDMFIIKDKDSIYKIVQ